jgi:hypothetical protein
MAIGFYVPSKKAGLRFEEGMAFGRSAWIPGRTHYVRPTTNYASFDPDAWVANHDPWFYDTVALALADCVSGRGDAIVLAPGTHLVETASLAMAKSHVSLWGPEAWMGQDVEIPTAILTTDITADQIMNITAPDCSLNGLTVRPITAAAGVDFSALANNLLVKGCHFDLYTPVVDTATVGLTTTGAATGVRILNSNFVSDGAQGNAIVATGLIKSLIQGNLIYNTAGTWASAILCGAATTGLFIIDNHILSYGTALTEGVNGTGATIASGVQCSRNIFGSLVTVAVDSFNAGECELAENYQMGVGGTDGGVLITAIT